MGAHDLNSRNSFDLLRLMAAAAVIAFHSAPLAGRTPWFMGQVNLGALGVSAFFVISGYLVTDSRLRSTSLRAFLAKRVLRIEPGLIASLMVTAFIIGAFATSLPLGEYLRRKEVYLYVAKNALLYPTAYGLPGVFEYNPMPVVVNGSLWTLRVEFTLYLGLGLLGALSLLRPTAMAALAVLFACANFVFLAAPSVVPSVLVHTGQIGSQCAFLFCAGALLRLIDRPLPAWTLASALLLFTPAWMLGLPILVVWLGNRPSVRLPADLSYGLYIYAFPVQQWLASHGLLSFSTSLAATLPFAAASWFLVEAPALRLKPAAARAPRAYWAIWAKVCSSSGLSWPLAARPRSR
jgi:peptidoglycan/LPS O-acetylase OafA/YrhL